MVDVRRVDAQIEFFAEGQKQEKKRGRIRAPGKRQHDPVIFADQSVAAVRFFKRFEESAHKGSLGNKHG